MMSVEAVVGSCLCKMANINEQCWKTIFEELQKVNADLLTHQRNNESYDVIFTLRQYRDSLQQRLDKFTPQFITSKDPTILNFARHLLQQAREQLNADRAKLMEQARQKESEAHSLTLAMFTLELANPLH